MNQPTTTCTTCHHWTKGAAGYGCRVNRDPAKVQAPKDCTVYYKIWDPEREPYRVVWFTKQRGYYRGLDRTQVFATLDEAMEARKQVIRGFEGAEIHVAVNAATWLQNGRWKTIVGKYRPATA
ncbi:MAG: hypothetical protein EOM92_19195 [Gammaproteobacteria bacterium]|nr:hypothetical protein [Gammaproteobacteria bacterium]